MSGALNVTQPCHLLDKLLHEITVLSEEPRNSYAALNALRDAYHLREWIWHGRLENNAALQARIMGRAGSEADWNKYVKDRFPDFQLIRELCNGSKHFERFPGDQVKSTHAAGYGSPLYAHGGPLGYGVDGLFMVLDGGRIVSVMHLLDEARALWAELFDRFPELA
jgi:hypothetical protein